MTQKAKTDSAIIARYQVNLTNRIYFLLIRIFVIGLIAFMITLLFLQELLLTHWEPPLRFNLAFGIAAFVATTITAYLYSHWIFEVKVFQDRIVFRRHFDTIEIPFDELRAVIGSRGVDLSGGEIFPWKYNVFIGETASAKLAILDESRNEQFLVMICNQSQNTLGVSLQRQLTLNVNAYVSAKNETKNWYIRSAFTSIALGSGGIFVLAAGISAIVAFAPNDVDVGEAVARCIAYVIVAVVVCVGIVFLGIRDLFSLRKLIANLDAMTNKSI